MHCNVLIFLVVNKKELGNFLHVITIPEVMKPAVYYVIMAVPLLS